MKVQYIKHSGFLVEFKEAAFVFDYYEGEFDLPESCKPIYFFVSHKHADHFNLDIFQYAKQYENVTFVVSKDAKMSLNYMNRHEVPLEARDRIIYVKEHQEIDLADGIRVRTLDSTDQGVAFLIDCELEGKKRTIYHAGDLNWWTWIGETKEEYDQMTMKYKAEIDKLRGEKIDLAMVVLDPRQEERFWWGINEVMKTAQVSCVIPMHCWEDYSVIDRFLAMEESEPYRDRIAKVHHPKEWIELCC